MAGGGLSALMFYIILSKEAPVYLKLTFFACVIVIWTLIIGVLAIGRKLRETEEEFKAVAENAHAAFGIVQGSRFVYANRYFAEMSGYSVSELLTMDFPQLVHPDFRGMLIERAKKRQMGLSAPSHYEFRMLRKDGTSSWVDFSPAATVYKGKPAIIGTGLTINHLKEIEEALRHAKEEAERANRVKDQFLAVLSHELRTPLTPVLASLSLLERQRGLGSREREIIDIARRNVELEVRLIDDLLDITRISQGKLALEYKDVPVKTVLESVIENCRLDIEARQLDFQLKRAEAAFVIGDVSRLQQVFWNLLNNAIKFTPKGGRIIVECFIENECVVVEVADTGVGFLPQDTGRLFNAFEQADKSTARRFGGLGLGLAISKRIVEMHGGSITAFSGGRGLGATFRVTLPCGTEKRSAPVAPAKSSADHKQNHLRILLVEDNSDTADIIGLALGSTGHVVTKAGDASTAVEMVKNQRFDLLISDIGLPDRSGLELIREIREAGVHVRAIALSGYGREEDVHKSLEAGFAEHITKPVNVDALESAIRRNT